MNCNTTHYRANSSSVPGDPTLGAEARRKVAGFCARLAAGEEDLAPLSAGLKEISALMDVLTARLLLALGEAPAGPKS